MTVLGPVEVDGGWVERGFFVMVPLSLKIELTSLSVSSEVGAGSAMAATESSEMLGVV